MGRFVVTLNQEGVNTMTNSEGIDGGFQSALSLLSHTSHLESIAVQL